MDTATTMTVTETATNEFMYAAKIAGQKLVDTAGKTHARFHYSNGTDIRPAPLTKVIVHASRAGIHPTNRKKILAVVPGVPGVYFSNEN